MAGGDSHHRRTPQLTVCERQHPRAVLPHTLAILFGRYVLRMNPLILLGACAGAGTVTAALRALQEESQSKLPALGYTVPYAVGNILLTARGPVIVAPMR